MDVNAEIASARLRAPMRVALISDLHANEIALDAVLREIEELGVDRIVCLGDVATLGPKPEAVVQRLRDLACPCILGNHDEFLFNPELVRSYTEVPVVVDAVEWCRARLSADDIAFVKGFSATLEIELSPRAKLFLFHGSPSSHMQNLLATTPPDELEQLLGHHRAAVMAGGHTHIQMLRQHRGTLLVNPGSVGMPFKEYVGGGPPTLMPWAEYAVVSAGASGIDVSLHRVLLDKRQLLDAIAPSDNPLRPMLLAEYSSPN